MNNSEENLGCCNMLIWDALIIFYSIFCYIPEKIPKYAFYSDWHTVFKILLSIVVCLLVIAICNLPVIGYIAHIFISIFWTVEIYGLLYDFFERYPEWKSIFHDKVWVWTIRIVLFLIFYALHIMSLGTPQSVSIGRKRGTTRYADTEAASPEEVQHFINNLNNLRMSLMTEVTKCKSLLSEAEVILNSREVSFEFLTAHDTLYVYAEESLNALDKFDGKDITIYEARQLYNEITQCFAHLQRAEQELHTCLFKEQRYSQSGNQYGSQSANQSGSQSSNRYNSQSGNQTGSHSSSNNSSGEKQSSDAASRFFAGCNDLDSVKKRFRELSKIYHPDVSNGDASMAQELNAAYQEELKKFHRD